MYSARAFCNNKFGLLTDVVDINLARAFIKVDQIVNFRYFFGIATNVPFFDSQLPYNVNVYMLTCLQIFAALLGSSKLHRNK